MPQPHILAVETYGKERIRGRASGAMLSAYKLGYSTATHAVLQALYGAKAVDVTPPRASYRYLSITAPTRTAKGFLLLTLTDAEQAQAESVTRKHSGLRSGCWRWHDDAWQAYPTQHDADYQTAVGAPRFNPSSYNPVSPSHAAMPQNTSGIQVERTQHDDNQPPWFWITGDTYPHRAVFKAAGCRWSKKRRAWYYIGDKLPASVQALVNPPDDDPEPPPAAPAMPDTSDDEPDYKDAPYAVGGKVRAAKTFDGLNPDTSKPMTIPANTRGTIVSCEGSVGSLGYAFHVDFEDLDVVWCFERDLVADESNTPPAMETSADESKGVAGVDYPRFSIGQTVYTHYRIKLDPNNPDTIIPEGATGQIVRRFHIKDTDKYELFGYLVQFNEAYGGKHQHPVFERTLDDQQPPKHRHIRSEEPIMLMPGASGQSLIGAHIARREAIPNGKDWDGDTAEPIAEPVPIPDDDEPVSVRVIQPEVLSDEWQAAVKSGANVSLQPTKQAKQHPIGQAFVGELTGSISGNVYCYGYATHGDTLLYLNFGGPRTSVEAIRAKLSKGDIVNLTPWDAPSIELSAGLDPDGKAQSGMFTTYLSNISEAKFTSAILVHEWLTDPRYSGKSVTGIFRTDDGQAAAKLFGHVQQLVKVAVFPAWTGYLYKAGQTAGLVRTARSGGDVDMLVVDLDVDGWTRLITGGLSNGVIALPQNHH